MRTRGLLTERSHDGMPSPCDRDRPGNEFTGERAAQAGLRVLNDVGLAHSRRPVRPAFVHGERLKDDHGPGAHGNRNPLIRCVQRITGESGRARLMRQETQSVGAGEHPHAPVFDGSVVECEPECEIGGGSHRGIPVILMPRELILARRTFENRLVPVEVYVRAQELRGDGNELRSLAESPDCRVVSGDVRGERDLAGARDALGSCLL